MSSRREAADGVVRPREFARVQGSDGHWYLSCQEVHAFLLEYVEGELIEARRREFERHLLRCRSCAAYLESYRATVELARAAHREVELDPAFIPRDLVTAILAARG